MCIFNGRFETKLAFLLQFESHPRRRSAAGSGCKSHLSIEESWFYIEESWFYIEESWFYIEESSFLFRNAPGELQEVTYKSTQKFHHFWYNVHRFSRKPMKSQDMDQKHRCKSCCDVDCVCNLRRSSSPLRCLCTNRHYAMGNSHV